MKKGLFILPLIALLVSGCNLTTPKSRGKKSSSEDTSESTSSTTSSTSKSSSSSSKTSSSSEPPSGDVYPTSISIPESVVMSVGETKTLEVSYYPENTTVKNTIFSSSDTSTVSVSSGQLLALQEGTATITARAVAANYTTVTATCEVTVNFDKTKLAYTYDDYIANNAYNFENCPLVGEPKLLIIPVWFSNSDTFIANKANVRSDIEAAYLGNNEQTGWRSVSSFYEEESKGIVKLTGTVTDWYSYNQTYQTVGDRYSGQSYTVDILEKAVDWFFTNNPTESKSSYDTNGDGYLDGIIMIYAAPDYDSLGDESYKNLWAYCSWLMEGSGTQSDPNPNVFFWASYDFMYGSNVAYSRTGKFSYGRGDTTYCSLDAHCFTHEMGHVLGLQDYYDYSNYNYSPAAGFSMQDYNVGGHDPYSVMAYGWANPYIPTTSRTITINDFQSSHDLILLANHTVTSPFDEYILLELYSPTGLNQYDSNHCYRSSYPQGPNVYGLRVWHVDARLTYWNGSGWSSNFTTNPTKGNVYHAMANTHGGMDMNGTPMGSAYYDYNLLQLIRNDVSETYTPSSTLESSHLFKQSSTFSLSKFNSQFVKDNLMNDGKALGWTFSVTSISGNKATISVVKQ